MTKLNRTETVRMELEKQAKTEQLLHLQIFLTIWGWGGGGVGWVIYFPKLRNSDP